MKVVPSPSSLWLRAEALKLTPADRLALATALVESLHDTLTPTSERARAIQRMRGLLKTEQPAPTDSEVAAMLEERRIEKYSL